MLKDIQIAINSIAVAQAAGQKLVTEGDPLKQTFFASTLTTNLMEAQNAIQKIQSYHTRMRAEIAPLRQQSLAFTMRRKKAAHQYADFELTKIAYGQCTAYAPQPEADGVRYPPFLCAECFRSGLHSHLTVGMGSKWPRKLHLICLTDPDHAQVLPPGEWTLENLGQPFTPR
ncbi:hypothetical protein [Comamonas sp. NoAH]|uniref:hypothetical protein n=1 Tax=Comamonas halotolerans TaxID=3041496 RepID=UPI0024E09BB2|nr:hypothetical protein [Comamonas sp. NoAH]